MFGEEVRCVPYLSPHTTFPLPLAEGAGQSCQEAYVQEGAGVI